MTGRDAISRPPDESADAAEPVVRYERRGRIAVVTMNRPKYRNAQNSVMTYALDSAFERAVNDNDIRVIVLTGAGDHFSAGHDIGTPERDIHVQYDRKAVIWWDHTDKAGADARYAREMEVYLGMCRRWREIPKPSIAMVHGACIADGLMLAWVCDLIVASDDAFFADPVVRMGIPGVEYFAHPWMLGPRFAKEALFTGDRFSAQRVRARHGEPGSAAGRTRRDDTRAGGPNRHDASVWPLACQARGESVRRPDGNAIGNGLDLRPAPRRPRAQLRNRDRRARRDERAVNEIGRGGSRRSAGPRISRPGTGS